MERIEGFQMDGELSDDPKCIKEAFLKFYKILFFLEYKEENWDALEKCLDFIPMIISPSYAMRLDSSIKLEEIEDVINSLANDKPLGPDGFPTNFYKCYRDWIGPELLELYEDVFKQGFLGS